MYITHGRGREVTGGQVAKMLRMHDKGASYEHIARVMNISATTVRRYCTIDSFATGYEIRDEELPFIATEKTCGGCMYFKKLHATNSKPNFCAYTLMTGKAKDLTVPCAKCQLKRREEK